MLIKIWCVRRLKLLFLSNNDASKYWIINYDWLIISYKFDTVISITKMQNSTKVSSIFPRSRHFWLRLNFFVIEPCDRALITVYMAFNQGRKRWKRLLTRTSSHFTPRLLFIGPAYILIMQAQINTMILCAPIPLPLLATFHNSYCYERAFCSKEQPWLRFTYIYSFDGEHIFTIRR